MMLRGNMNTHNIVHLLFFGFASGLGEMTALRRHQYKPQNISS